MEKKPNATDKTPRDVFVDEANYSYNVLPRWCRRLLKTTTRIIINIF